jgi:sulfate/thiosulfate transport system ATP-binding protein
MSIEVEHLTKRYDDVPVVDDISLRIDTGELFVLLGPSGSGKSTLLRMIAGLTEIDEGRVLLHDRDITGASPKDRGIGFVFQHYALFRHMRVADNIEFALSVKKVPAAVRRERRDELLRLVGLMGFSRRFPRQLSGGQQQRVALARALAHKPEVLLLDEPFGALDAKIRTELRLALRKIQRELGLTTIFVTHDQEEAFELADRVAVLHKGRLLETGKPNDLYLRPRSPFVATFLGAANLVVGECSANAVRLGPAELPLSAEIAAGGTARRVQILFRPEDVELSGEEYGEHPRLGRGIVEHRSFVGPFERLRLQLRNLPGVRSVAPTPSFGGGHLLVDAIRPRHEMAKLPLETGSGIWVAVRRFHLLAPARMRLLLDAGATPLAETARRFGNEIAARLDAHIELIGAIAEPSDDSPDRSGSDLGRETETGAEGFDIAVLGLDPERLEETASNLASTRPHLLLVPGKSQVPSRLLVCVAVGEPGKADVRFTERLAWQLGAEATVLTVTGNNHDSGGVDESPAQAERFLEECVRTLGERGVMVHSRLRSGPVLREINNEIEQGGHDMLVVGAPLPGGGHPGWFGGLVVDLLRQPPSCPLLIIQRQTEG